MQLGIFAKTFDGKDLNDVFSATSTSGFETVQFNMACTGLPALPDEIPPRIIAAVRAASSKENISISAVSATYNMIHPDVAQRQVGLRKLDIIATVARQMGTQLVTLCTGTRDPLDQWRHHPDNRSADAWHDLVHEMHKAIAIAERHDIYLGVEPEAANVVCDAESARRLIDEIASPRLKIIIDPANLVETETFEHQHAIISNAVKMLAPHIALAHAKDRRRSGEVVAAGTGDIDLGFFVKCLCAANFSGPLVTHGLSAAEAPGVRRFLHGLLAQ